MTTPSGDPRDWPVPSMDHGSGHKDTAFTWAMGELILARIRAGAALKGRRGRLTPKVYWATPRSASRLG